MFQFNFKIEEQDGESTDGAIGTGNEQQNGK